jgi:hypothetical protein
MGLKELKVNEEVRKITTKVKTIEGHKLEWFRGWEEGTLEI